MNVQNVLTERQKEAFELLCQKVPYACLYGGARSGKSMLFMILMTLVCLRNTSRHLIFRKYLSDLIKSVWYETLPRAFDLLEIPSKAYTFNKNLHTVFFANGSEIWLGGLENQKAQDKVLGKEYTWAWGNEASELESEILPNILSRLAQNSGIFPRLMLDFNPPETSHWTYELVMESLLNSQKINLVSMHMNPEHNAQNLNPQYLEILNTMPERQRKRFLEGLFVSPDEAIFKESMIKYGEVPSLLQKAVVAIDPATTQKPNSDETGIFSAGKLHDTNYKIADKSMKASPETWAFAAIDEYLRLEKISRDIEMVAEVNQGGDMVGSVIKNAALNVCCHCHAKRYWSEDNKTYSIRQGDNSCLHSWGVKIKYNSITASVSKQYRAEEFSIMLALDKWIFNKDADFKKYVQQLLGFTNMIKNNQSPDRVDAAIMAASRLNQGKRRLVL